MPPISDHATCRGKVCLLCLKKVTVIKKAYKQSGTNRVITERVKELIEQLALPHYRHYCDLPSLPNVLCETCRVKLQKKKNGKQITLTVPNLSKFMDFEYSGTVTDNEVVYFSVPFFNYVLFLGF